MSSAMTLPNSWALTRVGDICLELQYGYTASATAEPCGPRFLRITDIQDGQVQWHSVPYCAIEKGHVEKYSLREGDIVFARTGGTVGKSFIIGSVPETSVFASYLIRLTSHPKVNPRFLYYFFQSLSYWQQIRFKKGGLQGNVNATTLSSLELPLCATNEQSRIVAKIEELFSELDKGVETLTSAREQLKVYRQAVLKHAFEGQLTSDWRERNPDKLNTPRDLLLRVHSEREARYAKELSKWEQYLAKWNTGGEVLKKPCKPSGPHDPEPLEAADLAGLSALPKSWAYARLGEFIAAIEAGNSFKCDEREPGLGEIGVAKVSAVSWGEYDEAESKTCMNPERVDPGLFIRKGDFLLSRANTIELVGACIIVGSITKFVMLSDKTLRLHFDAGHKWFFLHYLRSMAGRAEIEKRSTGNQESMRNIGQDRIRNLITPICSGEEMSEVVARLEAQLTEINNIEEGILHNLRQAEALRQSVLKKAFSGQLVAQDPNDEPATVLMKRIRSEKEQGCHGPSKNKNKGKEEAA